MHARLIMAGILSMALGLGSSQTVLAHEGEHDEGRGHRQGQSRFLEGSGSSVLAPAPGDHEHSDEYDRHPKDVSSPHAVTYDEYEKNEHGREYEEGSGSMKSQHRRSPQAAPMREGSGR